MAEDKNWSATNLASGKLNSDDDLQATEPVGFPSSDYVYQLNLRRGGKDDVYSGGKSDIPGNLLISNELPDGENFCIGAYEDVYTPSIIFFNWNSNKNHGIYQYFPFQLGGEYGNIEKLVVSETLAFEKHWTITGMNLEEKKLFYWVQGFENVNGDIEGNPPRKINILKAISYNKKRQYQIIFDRIIYNYPDATQARLDLVIRDASGSVIASVSALTPLPKSSYLEFLTDLAEQIQSSLSTIATATACNCGIDFEFLEVGEFTLTVEFFTVSGIVTTPRAAMAYAVNFYPKPILNQYLDRIKYPPLFYPEFKYLSNPERLQNNLVGEYFQFATRYRYDDGEKSVKGPISKLAYTNLSCGVDDALSPYNFIRVDFSSDELKSEAICCILTGVDLLVRDGNNGLWRLVKTFDRCELDVTSQSFDFYNDGNYLVLDDTIEDIQHDIPLIGMTQEFVSNRGYIEAGLESYNIPECPDMNLELSYTPADDCSNEEMATITGRIYIHNPHDVTTATDAFFQPIYDAGTGIVFGGMSGTFTDTAGTNYNQWLYNRGFRVYSAGTEYSTYSVQNAPPGVTILPGSGNIYDAGNSTKRDAIRDAMLIGLVYSEFTLQVKAGTHIIRIASHLLQDLDNNTAYDALAGIGVWQKTSTYVDNIGGANFSEIIVTVSPGETLSLSGSIIMDLKDTTALYSVAYSGYLIDGETSSSQAILKESPRMELQRNIPSLLNPGFSQYNSYGNGGKSDHNGFWWGTAGGYGPIPTTNEIRFISTGVNSLNIHGTADFFYEGNLDNLNAETLISITELSVSNEHKPFIIYNQNIDVSNFGRTNIEGFIYDLEGGPAVGVQVKLGATNRVVTSSVSGFYRILVYGDFDTNIRFGYVVYTANLACCTEYPDGDKNYIVIGQFVEGGNYSIDFPFLVNSWIVNVIGKNIYELQKKRNKVIAGLVYSDGAGRCAKVLTSNSFETYIPFDTEPNGSVDIPIITWKINHAPPSWAKVFHVVRAKNSIYERYEQFIIGEVQYVRHVNTADEELILTSYDAGDATEIYIGMKTFIYYQEENADSQVIYIPRVGDRITFKLTETGELFDGFFDYRILNNIGAGTAADPLTIIIKFTSELPEIFPGCLVELWTPKLKTEESLFFETVDTKRILFVDGTYVHEGDNRGGQDQILGVRPAIGKFKTGDTWVYKRNMLTKDTTVDPDDKNYFLRQIESQYLNDWDRINTENPTSNSFQSNIGRPHVVDKEWAQLFHRTRIRWSGKYLSNGNTIINDYSTFRPIEYIDLEREYGTCMRLVRIGETAELMSIHKYKLQPLYTGFKELIDLTGQTFVGKTSEVISVAQPLVIKAGTSNPESVFVEGNYIYGWSTYYGEWWRYAGNGIEILSASNPYKVQKIAARKEDELKGIDPKYSKVYGAMHRDKNQAIWGFQKIDIGPTDEVGEEQQRTEHIIINAETIAFDEGENRWEGYYSYEPEAMVSLNSGLFTFKNGELYIHEKNTLYNNFYGQQYYPLVIFPRTMDPRKEKLFYSVRIIPALGNWSMPKIHVLPSEINPNGMESRLSANQFKPFKASAWADFLRDFTDPSFTDQLKALFEGRPLMGRILLITLTNNSTSGVYLNEINISSSESNQTL